MNCVETAGLSIRYPDVTALDDLDLSIPAEMLYGIIGPDGAGKTSLLRAICTLLPISGGQISVMGMDVRKGQKRLRALIGYMPQRFSLYQDLSVEQNILFFGRLFGVPKDKLRQRMEKLYKFSRLKPFANRLAGHLSGGMKQKLALSCALIHTPSLIVLDEPTFGVDPVSRLEFWQMLHELKAEGISIVVSTPYMDEAQQCDRVSLLHRGRIMTEGPPDEILARHPLRLYSLHGSHLQDVMRFMKALPGIDGLQMFGNEIHLSSKIPLDDRMFELWRASCPHLRSMKEIRPGMEDVFLTMMGS